MRDQVANKSMTLTSTGTCPSCGRPSTPYGCRDVPMGWWCIATGLKEDSSRWILPTRDPLTEAEQRTADAFAGPIADAERAVDEAMEWHAAAEQAHHRALLKARRAGVKDVSALVPLNSNDAHLMSSPLVTPEQREDAAEEERLARLERADAKETLSRARVDLTGISQRRDWAMGEARGTKTASKPRRSWLARVTRIA